MSMTRESAIKHFLARKYSSMTIGEAYSAAPAAARNGLHEADAEWIKRYSKVNANDAVKRLLIRSRANPDGLPTGPGRPSEGKTERTSIRMTREQRAKVIERGGSSWLLALIDAAK